MANAAVQDYAKAIEIDPEKYEAYYKRGNMIIQLRKIISVTKVL